MQQRRIPAHVWSTFGGSIPELRNGKNAADSSLTNLSVFIVECFCDCEEV